MDFTQKLNAAATKNSSLLCVGLDPDISRIPDSLKNSPTPQLDFNKLIIDATHDLVCAYKPNSAFYESKGAEGINDLKLTCEYIRQLYPDLPIILDFKRGDIGNTNQYYAQFAFEYLGVDAITVQPYVGKEALQAFLDYKNKGIFVLCKTSNPGAGELQDLKIDGIKLHQKLAENIVKNWNIDGNCHIVFGATYPEELAEVRKIVGENMLILLPGIGKQGGDLELSLKSGLNQAKKGLIVSSSRDIIYAYEAENTDIGSAINNRARQTRDQINEYINKL
jgi:orotidine-5'-phosphate decarboxylase